MNDWREVMPESEERIMPLLAETRQTVQKLDNNFIHIVSEISEIKADVQLIRKTLYGNGDRDGGMIGRQNSIDKWIDGQVWFQRLVISLIVAQAIGIVYIIANHVLGQ